jgi:hypothetical protein
MGKFITIKVDIDRNNRKPYRTKAQKVEARRTAKKINGTWVSSAPKSYHPVRKELLGLIRVDLEKKEEEDLE